MIYYCLWPHGIDHCAHKNKGEQITPQREKNKGWLRRQNQVAYQREVVENLHQILKEAPQAQIARDILPSKGILPLTQMGSTHSAGGHQIKTQIKKRLLEVEQIKVHSKYYKSLKRPAHIFAKLRYHMCSNQCSKCQANWISKKVHKLIIK